MEGLSHSPTKPRVTKVPQRTSTEWQTCGIDEYGQKSISAMKPLICYAFVKEIASHGSLLHVRL